MQLPPARYGFCHRAAPTPGHTADQFLIIAAVEQDGLALVAKLVSKRIKLGLGAHIHAFGRVIEQQHDLAGASAICR